MRAHLRAVASPGVCLLLTGCANRGVASGPSAPQGAGTWLLVWAAAGLAVAVVAALIMRVHVPASGGARIATTVLAFHAGAVLVGGALLIGLAVRSGPLANAKAAGTPASGTSLIRVSVTDGDPRFFTLMLGVVVLLSASLALALTMAARFAHDGHVIERTVACAVLGLELVLATYGLALVFWGHREWPYVVAALHVPVLTIAIATCWPRSSGPPDSETRYNGIHG